LKLAVSLGHGLAPSEVVTAARKLELFGYDFVWVSESVGFDSLPILGAIGTQTKRIGLGTGVVNVYSRSATQLAMAAATIEGFSPGRFILGIGASSAEVVKKWHGLDFSRQLKRVEEYADALNPMLKKGKGNLPAPFSSIANDIPLYIAGVGEKMVQLAKLKADGVLFFMRPLSDVDVKSRQLASDSFKVCANVVACVSGDVEAAEARARKTVAFYLTYGESYRRLVEHLGIPDDVREITAVVKNDWLNGRREEAARRVPQELLDEVAIYGTPSDCRKAIEEYSRVGGLYMLGLQFNVGERGISESLDLFSSFPKSL
jgi:5,10-methylenetetrahydromethanopterin reductase